MPSCSAISSMVRIALTLCAFMCEGSCRLVNLASVVMKASRTVSMPSTAAMRTAERVHCSSSCGSYPCAPAALPSAAPSKPKLSAASRGGHTASSMGRATDGSWLTTQALPRAGDGVLVQPRTSHRAPLGAEDARNDIVKVAKAAALRLARRHVLCARVHAAVLELDLVSGDALVDRRQQLLGELAGLAHTAVVF